MVTCKSNKVGTHIEDGSVHFCEYFSKNTVTLNVCSLPAVILRLRHIFLTLREWNK